MSSDHLTPVKQKKEGPGSVIFMLFFFSIFGLIGGLAGYFMFVGPMMLVLDAKDWSAVPSTIDSASIETHEGSGDSSDTYSLNVNYHYDYDGRTYHGDRYSFFGGSSSSKGWREQALKSLTPGKTVTCYVDPDAPDQAVLHRGLISDAWFGLIPLVFVLVGLGGIVWTIRRAVARKSGAYTTQVWTPLLGGQQAEDHAVSKYVPQPNPQREATTLTPKSTPKQNYRKSIIAVVIFGLAAGGLITAIMMGGRATPLYVFTGIFSLAVVISLVSTVYWQLATKNPVLTLTLSNDQVVPGEVLDVAWDLVGEVERIEHLRIWIEGHEEATYRRGTNTYTKKETFLTLDIVDSHDAGEFAGGLQSVTIPHDTMHSFDAPNNKIIWKIKACGDIPRWPDVSAEYDLVVTPQPHDAKGALK